MTTEPMGGEDRAKAKEPELYSLEMKTILMIMAAFMMLGMIAGFGIYESIERYHANKTPPTKEAPQCR